MAHSRRARGHARGKLDHETAQAYLFDYYYHRLPRDLEIAVEAHARSCAICRAEGLRHLATERVQAMQQRPKPHPHSARPVIAMLALVLTLFLGSAGIAAYRTSHGSIVQELFRRSATGSAAPTATSTPTATPAPAALGPGTTLGLQGTVTVATSPDGRSIALAANPAALGGTDPGGVTVMSGTAPAERLAGFEQLRAPGSLAWSPDGQMLAASGLTSLLVWQVSSGQIIAELSLPASPGTDLSVFDRVTGAIVSTAPATIFAASGFVQWESGGKLSAAPAGAAGATNVPDSSGAIFALWGSQQGVRIFSTGGTTMIGMDDTDVQQHAAFLHWSPDGRYLVWGYPRLAITSTLLGMPSTASSGNAGTVGAPDAAVAALVNAVGQQGAGASAAIWYGYDEKEAIVADATRQPSSLTVRDPETDVIAASFDLAAPAQMPLGGVSWLAGSRASIVIATGSGPAREIALGGT
jgi:hypothetical protein